MAAPAAILSVVVNAQTGPAVRGLMRVNTALDSTAKKASRTTNVMKSVGKVGAVGVAVGLGFAVKKAADFESQMSSLGAVSGATGREMGKFKKQALDAGAATKFSALDAAKAQTELAKGGLSVAQIMSGGLKSALALAAAGEMDLAAAASTTANAMNLFGLKGRDAMKVADMLAEAANATTADVSDFAMALQQGGSVAKSAGLSFRETVLALEAMAKSGIKNSDAGTSLKTALIQLLKPSAKQAELTKTLGLNFLDAGGKMKSMAGISAMLRDKLGGMTKAQRTAALATIAGTDGVRTLTSLYDAGPAKLEKWSQGLAKGGTAATVAAKKQDNLKGKIENLMGSLETLAIIIGMKLIPFLSDAAVKVTGFLNEMQKGTGAGGQFVTVLRNIGTAFIAIAGPLANVAANVGKVGFQFLQTKAGVVLLAAVLGGLVGRLAFLAGAWAVAKVMAFTSAIGSVITMIRTAIAITTTLRAAMALLAASMVSTGIGAFVVAVGVVAGALMGMKTKTDSAALSQTQFRDAILQTRQALDQYADASSRIKDAQLAHQGAVLGLRQAEANLQTLRRSGTATAQQLKQAEHEVAVAKNEVSRTTKESTRAQRDEGATKRKAIADAREQIATLRKNSEAHRRNVAALRVLIRQEGGWKLTTEQVRRAQRALRSEMGKGRASTLALKQEQLRLAVATGASKDTINGLRREINQLESKEITVQARVDLVNNVTDTLKRALSFSNGTGGGKDFGTGASRAGPVETEIGEAINYQLAHANWKDLLSPLMQGGGLLGAPGGNKGAMATYMRIAAGMGLSAGTGQGQGFRAGDPGWHGKDRARDSSGSAGAMLAFAKLMFNRYGGNLLELIYTPMGKAIKNGAAVAPYAQADHYDHVHVAAAKGAALKSHRATSPTVLFGEEAPRHPEYFISTNPRDKQRSTGLLAQATQEITGKRLAQFKTGGRRDKFKGLAKDVWAKTAPLMGASGSMPSVGFGKTHGNLGWTTPGRKVRFAPRILDDLDKKGFWRSNALNTIVHEFAHTRQGAASRREREGGATWFARKMAPGIFSSLKMPYSNYPEPWYAKELAWVKKHRSKDWLRNKQFWGRSSGFEMDVGGGGGAKRRYPGAGFNWAYKNYPAEGSATLSVKQVRQVAEMAGFSPGRALQMAQIARGESTYKPGADGGLHGTPGPPGYGLWQITPGAWGGSGQEAIYRKFHSLGSRKGMFTPIKNAKMAKFMYGQSGFGPWVGTQYLDRGMNVSGVGSVLGANTRSGGGGAEPASPMSKRNRKILKRIPKRLKKIKGIGLSKKQEGWLKHLTTLSANTGEWASRAGGLSSDTLQGKVGGHDEAYWLQQQLATLFQLRNTLIKYEALVVKKRERVLKMISSAHKFLQKLQRHPKQNKKLIEAYKKQILPALRKRRSGLSTRRGELLSSLEEVQGIASPMGLLKKLPAVGALGGQIFATQTRLRELGQKTSVTDTSSTVEKDTESADLLRQLLQQANLRTAVSERQYDVFKDLPYAGSFGGGGVVPGPAGRPMSAVVHGGESIGQPGGVDVKVYVHENGKGADVYVDDKRIESVVEKVTRRQARAGQRGLPGGRG